MLPRLLIRLLFVLPFVVIAYLVVTVPVVLNRSKPSLHLTGEEAMTLFSIDPASNWPVEKPVEGETIRRYAVLGKVEITDAAQRKEIAERVNRAVANRAQEEYKCFNPRHAIRASQGDDARDFLLCFECFN